MKIRIDIFILISATALLTACSSMNGSFDCPNKAGVMCQSVDQINSLVDRGQLQGRDQPISSPLPFKDQFQPYPVTSYSKLNGPVRYGETVQRIWVAPFEDTEHNYHEASYLYTVINESHWAGV